MLQDLKSTSKHSFVYALGNIATKIMGVILIPIYTNETYLLKVDYGALAILEATAQILLSILSFSMVSSIQRWYWDGNYIKDQKSIFFTTIVFLLVINIPVFLSLFYFSNFLSVIIFSSQEFENIIELTILSVILGVLNGQIQQIVRLQSKSLFYTILQLAKLGTSLSLTILFVTKAGKGLAGIWEATLIGELVVLFISFPFLIRNIAFSIKLNVLREMISYGFPLIVSTVSVSVLTVTDRYMLQSMKGLELVGVYALGLRIANTLNVVVTTSLNSALAPIRMKKISDPNNKRFYAKILTYISLLFIFSLLVLSISALEILKIFTKDSFYWVAYQIVPVLSFAFLISFLKDNINIAFVIKKKTKILGLYVVIVAIINLFLNMLLIPLLDIYGAALSTLISQTLLFLMLYFKAQKIYYIPYEWKKFLLLISVAFVFIIMGNYFSMFPIILRISLKLVLIISFPIMLYFFKFFDEIEKMNLIQLLNTWKNPRRLKENFLRLIRST